MSYSCQLVSDAILNRYGLSANRLFQDGIDLATVSAADWIAHVHALGLVGRDFEDLCMAWGRNLARRGYMYRLLRWVPFDGWPYRWSLPVNSRNPKTIARIIRRARQEEGFASHL